MQIKILCVLALFVLLIGSVFAVTFEQDTQTNYDGSVGDDWNVNCIFKADVSFQSIEIYDYGIILNGNHNISIVPPDGYNITITIYNWNGLNHNFGIKSDAPTNVDVDIKVDDIPYYLYDGDYYLSSYLVTTNEKFWVYKLKGSGGSAPSGGEQIIGSSIFNIFSRDANAPSLCDRYLFSFEYNVQEQKDGSISGKTFGLSYCWLIFLVLLGILIGIITFIVRRRNR